jgi:hypothetical protein
VYNQPMNSWRNSTPIEIQADLDTLLDMTIKFCQDELAKRGLFAPVAFAFSREMSDSGATALAVDANLSSTDEEHDLLRQQLLNSRNDWRSFSIAVDVGIAEADFSDAIRVELVSPQGGVALYALLPYRISLKDGAVEFGDLAATSGDTQFWLA